MDEMSTRRPHGGAGEDATVQARPWLRGAVAAGAAGATFAALVLGGAPGAAAEPAEGEAQVAVVVEGGGQAAAAAVERFGGSVEGRLSVLDGLHGRVPSSRVEDLLDVPGVRAVTPDSALRPLDEAWGDDTTGEGAQATLATGSWQADHDQGSAFTITKTTGAQVVWGKSDPNNGNRKLTGHGVGVALVDTGVAPVEGLITTGKVVNGPDLSFESQVAGTRYVDGFGHGTHMAGLIAGKDSAVPAGGEADAKHFVGMAPDARIVNVKVGAGDGGVDVSQVVAGIDWVVTNRRSHNIRVLNLSYGTDSTQPAALDPLAHAVESAWRAGIVVVVAAGNDGEAGPRPLTMPAIDPFVIAVGSSDHLGTDAPTDDRVGAWTNSGTTTRRPDLLAPGKSVVSLRVPGSRADVDHPEGLIAGEVTKRMFRGTGTSQSAAVVSGAAALLLQRNPSLTPDQVKGLLRASADKLAVTNATQGAGVLDVMGAVELLEKGTPPSYAQTFARSTGTGTLEASRGGSHVVDPANAAVLSGEKDVFGVAWNASGWASASTAGTAWSGGTWRGRAWAGTGWSNGAWAPVTWAGTSWSGLQWAGRRWSTMTFLGRRWSGDDWSGRRWSDESWSGRRWSGESSW
ncbi:S8 family serine peptidase [Quadrisphaera sp. DSM 44207]|uniref:S8 family serine peptidase n=1 Tax=Quadrisphaera sp. DSM 44207 TaxID=1881057 RepID=UPI00088AF103|nr:S8 family serine peptidase [Quadrisphaera sp. DSM 44207]SDQ62732.1 serine protease AprX [Quadrisphaera sp. DSM 44207]